MDQDYTSAFTSIYYFFIKYFILVFCLPFFAMLSLSRAALSKNFVSMKNSSIVNVSKSVNFNFQVLFKERILYISSRLSLEFVPNFRKQDRITRLESNEL